MTLALLAQLHGVAQEAGHLIYQLYGEGFDVDYKAPDDPVTSADKAANALIISRLSGLHPDIPIVAEESAPESYEKFRDAERVFFVDPIDGTRDFVKRNGEFVVMIGLLEQERPSLGVVLAPVTGEAWLGCVGTGAWHATADGTRTEIRPSRVTSLDQALMVASRSHAREATRRATQHLGIREVRALGSAGLKGAHVATGEADLYLSPGLAGKRWDACAIDAIVNAAGGRFSDAHGDPLDYRDPDLTNRRGLLASNALLHDAALAKLSRLRESAKG